jgi:hypothetical protein
MTRIVEAEGEHERYRWKREGLRWAVRAGTGTRVLFRTWRERTAMIMCTELLCAYNDGYFVRSKQAQKVGCKNFEMRDGRGFCRNCGFHHDEH